MTPIQRLVYDEIHALAMRGLETPGHEALGAKLHLGGSTVRKAVLRLQERGVLRILGQTADRVYQVARFATAPPKGAGPNTYQRLRVWVPGRRPGDTVEWPRHNADPERIRILYQGESYDDSPAAIADKGSFGKVSSPLQASYMGCSAYRTAYN